MILVGVTLFLPRLIVLLVTLFSTYGLAKLSVVGWQTQPRPTRSLPTWRRIIQKVLVPPLTRMNMFSLGFHYIKVNGRPAPRTEAPILVSNHQGFLDIWIWLWQLLPVGVSAAENKRFPIMGEIMLAFQTIFVDREDGSSGKTATEQIKATVEDARYPQVVIYPEGNTCNGRALCGFKMGAFLPGKPVQPVVIQYKNPSLDASWCEPLGIPVHILALRMLLELNNTVEITYLDPVVPTKAMQESPELFARAVQSAMAEAMAVPVTQYSFGDTALMFRARKYGLPPEAALMEMDRATQVFGAGTTDCKECLEHFANGIKAEHGGSVPKGCGAASSVGLATALGLEGADVSTSDSLMETFDQDKSGTVSFREFVAGLAPLAAKRKAEEGSFYARAIMELKENVLK